MVDAYVIIEPGDDSPRIRGFDSFICPWRDVSSVVSDYLHSLESGEARRASLAFTIHKWTRDELEAYCEENCIEWRG